MIICFRQFKWDSQYNGFFFALLVQWRILTKHNKYKAFWQQQICNIYREKKNDGLAFSTTYEGLPKWTDKI